MVRAALVGVLAGVVAGCGGGGGGGAAGPVPLTAATAPDVAAAVLGGMESASTALFSVRGAGRGAFRGGNLLIQGFDIGDAIDTDPLPPEPELLSLQRGTIDCGEAGTVTVAGSPDTEADLATGATYSVSYEGCVPPSLFPGAAARAGRWEFVVNDFEGRLQGEHSLAVDLSVAGFTVGGPDGLRISGTGGWISTVTGAVWTQTLLADGLTVSSGAPGSVTRYEFDAASLTGTALGVGFADLVLDGTLGGTALGGTVQVATEAPVNRGVITVPGGEASGVFIVRSGAASMRVTLVASDQLDIELDADGDGIAEQFLPVQLVAGEYVPRPT